MASDSIWIGKDLMEIFSLWCQARITFYSGKYYCDLRNTFKEAYRATSSPHGFLPNKAGLAYSIFVSELIRENA